MFIIPLTGKISVRNPPIVTIAIVLINCLVWFILQAGDTDKQHEASELYFTSGLVNIEISHYLAYRDGRLGEPVEVLADDQFDQETLVKDYLAMLDDDLFQQKLKNDEIIAPADPVYAEWKDLKTEYEALIAQLTSRRYGFIPKHKSLLTSFTYMFMHGSTGHLLGNMIFLWIVGCMLEMGSVGQHDFFVDRRLHAGNGIGAPAIFSAVYIRRTVCGLVILAGLHVQYHSPGGRLRCHRRPDGRFRSVVRQKAG